MRKNPPRNRKSKDGGNSEASTSQPQEKAKWEGKHDRLIKQEDSDTEMFIKAPVDHLLDLSTTLIQDRQSLGLSTELTAGEDRQGFWQLFLKSLQESENEFGTYIGPLANLSISDTAAAFPILSHLEKGLIFPIEYEERISQSFHKPYLDNIGKSILEKKRLACHMEKGLSFPKDETRTSQSFHELYLDNIGKSILGRSGGSHQWRAEVPWMTLILTRRTGRSIATKKLSSVLYTHLGI